MVINKKNVDQRNISRIGITLLIVNRPYISWFYLNFETYKNTGYSILLSFLEIMLYVMWQLPML
ncbi:hypothetical protein D3510_15480 [Salmonella enterica]|nr:hypothetical protein [Salmonella enterica]EBM7012629.1 hypothetical protein [Salmonella enterica]EDT5942976.1 hypothetical protein [Salmonella enterica subsp. enterica serovar Oranienburg]